MMKADLHIHSEYSFDGSESLDKIIELAKAADIEVISICDHNTTEVYKTDEHDIRIIPGIEIDCYFNDTIIHLLGYGINPFNEAYKELRSHYFKELDRISYQRLKLIEERYNCKLDINKIKELSPNDFFTNCEITKVLLEESDHPGLQIYKTGSKSENPIADFYWDNLSIGKWGYTALDIPDYRDIIKLLHDDGAVCICAHPFVNIGLDESAVDSLITAGIDGFEAYCSYHNKKISDFYHDICEKHNLIFTCGSDFHGINKPKIAIGQHHYPEDYSEMLAKIDKRDNI